MSETKPQVGIIVGSIRTGRAGSAVGAWVYEQATKRGDADYRLIELADFDLPLLTDETLPAMANGNYDSEERTRWGQAIDACDAFVFVTPEYNHGVPGAFKNAVDALGNEWKDKPVGFVGYGAQGGVRAVEQWRQILANFDMIDVRTQVAISTMTEFEEDGTLSESAAREKTLGFVLRKLGLRLG